MSHQQADYTDPYDESQKLVAGQPNDGYSTITPQPAETFYDAEIAKIEADFKSCPYTCYSCWILFVFVCCIILLAVCVVSLIYGVSWLLLGLLLSSVWNIYQLYQERKAMKELSLAHAERALLSFKFYIVAMPIVYLIIGVVAGETAGAIIGSVIGNVVLFYLLIMHGGIHVARKLRRREELGNKIV